MSFSKALSWPNSVLTEVNGSFTVEFSGCRIRTMLGTFENTTPKAPTVPGSSDTDDKAYDEGNILATRLMSGCHKSTFPTASWRQEMVTSSEPIKRIGGRLEGVVEGEEDFAHQCIDLMVISTIENYVYRKVL